MEIEIITTGDEVMQGVIVDTNAAWIAERVNALGHEIVRHSAVGDDIGQIGDVLVAASKRAGCVIVTGGLGPTSDDVTIEAAAKAFGVELESDKKVLEGIGLFFERVGRPMSRSNEKQAMIPKGGQPLVNRVGTAPGIKVGLGGAEFFFLPGVPKELYQIFDESVMPWLAERAGCVYRERILRCFGIPEASIDEKLKGVDLGGARLSFRVKFPEILLKLVARAASEVEARNSLDRAAENIRSRLGKIVYGEGGAPLAEVVGEMLAARKMTLAIAESCTGGLMASQITDVPGASGYFERGVVAYSNRSKIEMLRVAEQTIESCGAVSAEAAEAMAEGVRRISGAAIGVAITGIAGPGGGTPEKPVGTVYVAIAAPDGTESYRYTFGRDREWFKQIVVATAIDLVRRWIMRHGA